MAAEKRKQAQEEAKANRERARAEAAVQDGEDTSILDNLLEKLRNGDNVGRKRRDRHRGERRPAAPLNLSTDTLLSAAGTGNDTADLARDMLARLKSDGFEALSPSSPTGTTSSSSSRRSRRRVASSTPFKGISEELEGSMLPQVEESAFEGDTSMSAADGLSSPTSPSDSNTGTPGPNERELSDTTDRETAPGAQEPR